MPNENHEAYSVVDRSPAGERAAYVNVHRFHLLCAERRASAVALARSGKDIRSMRLLAQPFQVFLQRPL